VVLGRVFHGRGAKYATTTDYVFNGDSLVATIDQQTASGNATGTAKTRYVHPDHLVAKKRKCKKPKVKILSKLS
jgi:hypothetical protein